MKMPLPTPNEGEKEDEFISRCIKFVIDEGTTQNTDDGRKQAAAICYGQWRKKKSGNTTRTIFKTMNAKIIDNPSIENKSKSKTNRQRQGAYTAVAMVGDQFWNKGRTKEFCLFDGIKKGYKSMDKTFHNLDHGADPHGSGHIRIQDIVGIQDYTEVDEDSKQMIMYIYPDEKMPSYSTWKAFVDMCQNNDKTPNVSIEAMVTQEQMMAKDIPVEDLDYKQYSIDDDDLVWVETGYRFVGAATVYMGACDDSDGCGILSSIDVDSPTGESTVNNETVILQADVSKNDTVVSNCDCNTATMTVNVKNEANNIIEAENMPEENKIIEEKPDTRLLEIEQLKTKLTTCGEVRQMIVDENAELKKKLAELENKYQVLLKETQELQEKLNKPITTIEEPQKNETVRDRGIKALEHLTGKKFKY
jgi:hypothetical protein